MRKLTLMLIFTLIIAVSFTETIYCADNIESVDGENKLSSGKMPDDSDLIKKESKAREIFIQRLSMFTKSHSLAWEDKLPFDMVAKDAMELSVFANQYPDNQYADDAQVVWVVWMFIGVAEIENKMSAKKFIKLMMKITKNNRGEKLEEVTKKLIHESMRKTGTDGYFCLPYQYLVGWMKGYVASRKGGFVKPSDAKTIIREYSVLKENLSFENINNIHVEFEIHFNLLLSYIALERKEKVIELMDEIKDEYSKNDFLMRGLDMVVKMKEYKKLNLVN